MSAKSLLQQLSSQELAAAAAAGAVAQQLRQEVSRLEQELAEMRYKVTNLPPPISHSITSGFVV